MSFLEIFFSKTKESHEGAYSTSPAGTLGWLLFLFFCWYIWGVTIYWVLLDSSFNAFFGWFRRYQLNGVILLWFGSASSYPEMEPRSCWVELSVFFCSGRLKKETMETIVFIIFSLAFLTCPVFFWQVPVAGPKAWPWGQICDGTLRPETDGQRSSAESNFMVEWSSSFWPGLLDLFRSPKNRGKSCRFPWPIQCRSNDIILPLFKGMKHAVRHSARCSICKSCKIQYGFVQKLSIYIYMYIYYT